MSGPVIVGPNPTSYFVKPGLHSHNAKRRLKRSNTALALLDRFRVILFVLGLSGVGFYAYTLSDQYVYQAYQNWAFDQQIAGRAAVSFTDYLRERTPFGFLVGEKSVNPAVPTTAPVPVPVAPELARPVEGALLGRVEIGRLNLSSMVREGVDAKTLSVAVGHVPSTALPGQPGNFAIAAHRDTLFRALKDIKKGDVVTFQSTAGTYTYEVASTKIVRPSDISVLQPDGGGLIPDGDSSSGAGTQPKLLTMITCYPFYYVGSAPKRFIVEAKLVSSDPETRLSSIAAQDAGPPVNGAPAHETAATNTKPKIVKRASLTEPRQARGFSHHSASRSTHTYNTDLSNQRPKKRHFWHKLVHAD